MQSGDKSILERLPILQRIQQLLREKQNLFIQQYNDREIKVLNEL